MSGGGLGRVGHARSLPAPAPADAHPVLLARDLQVLEPRRVTQQQLVFLPGEDAGHRQLPAGRDLRADGLGQVVQRGGQDVGDDHRIGARRRLGRGIYLDLLGQARNFLSYAAELNGCGDEDTLAFGRDERRFSNLLLVEQPNGNFADTIARQFFIDVWHVALYSRLVNSRDAQLAAIAAKGLKEVRYHQRFSRGWLERLGNGTELSNRKMQQAVDNLWRFTGELFLADEVELSLVEQGIAVDPRELQAEWQSAVHTALLDSGLQIPQEAAFRSGGKQGLHSEHLGPLLAEMQYLQRSHPGLQW